MTSISWDDCTVRKHSDQGKVTIHSPNSVDLIYECTKCCKAWMVNGLTGEIIRLYGSYETRLVQQKYNN